MFCKNCGNALKDGSIFCQHCGSPVNDYVVSNTETADTAVPVSTFVQPPVQNVPIQNSVPVNFQQPTGYVVNPAPNTPPSQQYVPIQNPQNIGVPTQPPVYNAPINQPIYQNAPVQPQNTIYVPYTAYPAQQETPKKPNVFSIMALIFGIVGIVTEAIGILFSPAALIFGIIGRKKSKSGMAFAGIILGAIGTGLAIISIVTSLIYSENILDSFFYFDEGLHF